MDQLFAFLQNKKVLIALGITILLIAIFSVVLLSIPPGQPASENTTSSILTQRRPEMFISPDTNTQVNPLSTSIASSQTQITNPVSDSSLPVVTAQPDVWLIGDHDFFTIDFLSSWKPVTNTVYKGGTTVTIKPTVLLNGDMLPDLHIEVTASDSAYPLNEKVKSLSPLGLSQTNILFHDLPAIRLSGTLPFKPLPDNPNQSLIYKTYILVDKAPNTYVINYSYYLNSDASKYQQIFDTMLDSFRFK